MPIKKNYDKDFFKQWSADLAYILGFIFADGNLVETKRGTYFLAIYTADKDLIYEIRKVIKSDHKISERNSERGKHYRIQIGSRELLEDLRRYSLFPNKASRMRLPNIPSKYIGHFVRGYFDGDGNIWSGVTNRHRKSPTRVLVLCFTSASFNFLSALQMLLKAQGILGGSLRRSKSRNYARLSFSTVDSLKIYKIMYNEQYKLSLARKKLVFDEYMKNAPVV